jgi:hypothetical protein
MFVVGSSKGGVGKSTVVKNLVIPYLLKKFGRTIYVNTDDTNDEDKLVKAKHYEVKSLKIPPDKLTKLDPLPEVVLDTGAGRNVKETLDVLAKLDYQEIATVVIVLSKRLSEINEAIKVYNYAKKLGFNKFAFVLNKVIHLEDFKDEFVAFFSPLGGKKPVELIEDHHRNFILFPLDEKEVLGTIQDLEKRLPYDVLKDVGEFLTQYRKKLKEGKTTEEDRTKRLLYGDLEEIFQLILSEKNLQILEEVQNG